MHLRFFSVGGMEKQVFAYDKEADDIYIVAIADAAAQSGYYTSCARSRNTWLK